MVKFILCEKHAIPFPEGAVCPRCTPEFKERERKALDYDWDAIVPFDRRLDFIHAEKVYCRDEEFAFQNYDGQDANHREELRIAVLEKRAEFLQLFIKIIKEEQKSVHQSEDSDREGLGNGDQGC